MQFFYKAGAALVHLLVLPTPAPLSGYRKKARTRFVFGLNLVPVERNLRYPTWKISKDYAVSQITPKTLEIIGCYYAPTSASAPDRWQLPPPPFLPELVALLLQTVPVLFLLRCAYSGIPIFHAIFLRFPLYHIIYRQKGQLVYYLGCKLLLSMI